MDLNQTYEVMKNLGLFACPLNNGDWMVGPANHIYSLKITQDHYMDEYLSIAETLPEAVDKYCEEQNI